MELMQTSRRALLAGASSLFAMGVGACSSRAGANAAELDATSSKVGPAPAWTGAAGSGFSGVVPTDEARIVAKPAVRWAVADRQRFASDLAIGVDADALGGMAHVEFYVEGTKRRATEWIRLADTDVNGFKRTRGGYWITLDHAAFMAASKTPGANEIRVYAVATAADPTFQTRTIGPLTLYPEATASDFVKTIAPSGADFTSIKAALNAARLAGARAPLFTITRSGFYNFESGDWPTYVGRGYCVITHAPGVIATIGKSEFPGGLTSSAWHIDPRFDGLEFRGSGIVIDHRNFHIMIATTVGHRLNGCKVTSSEGTPYTYYWNKGYKPQGLFNPTPACTVEDSVIEFGNAQVMNLALCRNNKLHQTVERLWNGTMEAFDNYSDGTDTSFFRVEVPALSLSYNGASPNATIEKTGNNDASDASLVLRENGAIMSRFPLGRHPNDPYYQLSDLVAAINAVPGWSATLLDTSGVRRSSYLIGNLSASFGSVNGFGQTALARGESKTLVTFLDIHSGGWNVYSPGKIIENAILRNNIALSIDTLSAQKNFTAVLFDATTACQDMVFDGNLWDGGIQIGIKNTCPLKHVVFRNNTATIGVRFSVVADTNGDGVMNANDAFNIDQYTVLDQNVFYSVSGNFGIPTYPIIRDNYIIGALSGPNHKNNIVGNTNDTRFVNIAAKDFRPAGVLVQDANKRSTVRILDGRGFQRAKSDSVGAWAQGYSLPILSALF